MTIKPTSQRILVKTVHKEVGKTKSGIVLVEDMHGDGPLEGIVIAVGEGVDDMIEPGKRILFSRATFNQVTIDDEEYHFLIEEDVFGVY